MSILHSFREGGRRVWAARGLAGWLYLASLVASLPLALALAMILRRSLGASLVADNLREGFDLAWHGEFAFRETGLADSFGPWVTGMLPVVENLEGLLDGEPPTGDWTLLLAGLVFLLVWAFFGGGIVDRYASPEETHSRGRLFAKSGEYFFRFVRLLVISALFYAAVFRWVGQPLHRRVEEWTRDVTSEQTVLLLTMVVYLVVGVLLVLISLAADYGKIALVVEHRRSALLAFLRGLRFVFSHPGKTSGLYALLLAVGLGLVALYAGVAPGPGQRVWWTVLVAFLVGQVYVLARIGLKLWFLSSQTVLFQSAEGLPTAS